jgi:hypothetical protein
MSASVPYTAFHCWFKKEFEKLGWMVLALVKANKGEQHSIDKIKMYKESVVHLKMKLMVTIDEITEPDRKRDLNIYLEDVNYLLKFIDKHLVVGQYGGVKKRKSKKSKLSRK